MQKRIGLKLNDMKVSKKTVYLSTDGYYDWLVKSHSGDTHAYVEQKEGFFFTTEELNSYIQTIIKQSLETAAKKATIYHSDMDERYDGINQESITNTFDETFNKFKV